MASIFQINTSPGGIPKRCQQQGYINTLGIIGDQHLYEKHGGQEQALCLYSLERILALQAAGSLVFPGALGENLTLTGLDWDALVEGVRLKLGKEVLVEISGFATPCHKLLPYLKDGDLSLLLQQKNPGWARPYARVLKEGVVFVGDEVLVVA